MNLSIETYLVQDNHPPRNSNSELTSAIEGIHIYPIGSTIPLIVRGHGCVGLAKITGCYMREINTSVNYYFVNCSDATKKVLYDQYRNMISVSSDDSYEDVEDTIIPGIATGQRPSSYRGRKKPYHDIGERQSAKTTLWK